MLRARFLGSLLKYFDVKPLLEMEDGLDRAFEFFSCLEDILKASDDRIGKVFPR
jgi:hypothetical protein